jgi:preprotein translocase subunit SecE
VLSVRIRPGLPGGLFKLSQKAISKSEPGAPKRTKPVQKNRKSVNPRFFFQDVRSELKKVIWPDRPTVVRSVGLVFMIVFVFAGVVTSFDFVVSKLLLSLTS